MSNYYSVIIFASMPINASAGEQSATVAEIVLEFCITSYYADMYARHANEMLQAILEDECAIGPIADFIKMVRSNVSICESAIGIKIKFN